MPQKKARWRARLKATARWRRGPGAIERHACVALRHFPSWHMPRSRRAHLAELAAQRLGGLALGGHPHRPCGRGAAPCASLIEKGALAIAHALEIARLGASLETKQPRGGGVGTLKVGVRDVGAGKIGAGKLRPG